MIETTLHPKSVTELETVYQDHLRRIYRKVAEFDGFTKYYLVSDTGARAAVLVTQGSYVLLVRQYRLLISDISLEIPGGKVDNGETAERTATRECLEETGVECRNINLLLNYHLGLDVTYNPTYIFYSEEVVQKTVKRDERVVWLPIEVCLDMVLCGKIQDAMTIIALLTYYIQIHGKRKPNPEPPNEINPICIHTGIYPD
jgi:ADP-ribose pyrophosphatase